MSQYKITLNGLESYMTATGDSLFKDISLPSGIDKEVFIYTILTKANEMEVLYSDPFYLKDSITLWGRKWYRTFDKWVKALDIKYDPLYNFDRYEEYTDDHEGSGAESRNGSGSNTSKTEAEGSSGDDTTTTGETSAYNSSDYQPTDKSTTETDVTTESSSETTGSYNDKSDLNKEDKYKNVHSGHLYGNIGVTTSQQMLESELNIAEWNLYEHIADIFLKEFIILVY